MAISGESRVLHESSNRSARTGRSLRKLLVFFAFLPVQSIAAQEMVPAGSTAAIESTAPAATSIPIGDIGVAAERAKSVLARDLVRLEPTEAVRAAAASIPEFDRRVETELERSDAVLAATPSVLAIDRLQGRWKNIEEALSDTQSSLRKRGAEIDLIAQSARDIRALWTATRTNAIGLGTDGEIIGQIDAVLTSTATVIEAATSRQSVVVGLQSSVARMSEIVTADRRKIVAARDRAVSQSLTRDTTPTWEREFWRRGHLATVAAQLVAQKRRDVDSLVEFWATQRNVVVLYALSSVAIVMLVFTSRRRIDQRLAGDSDLASVRAIFARPIALSLLIVLFVSPWIITDLYMTFEPLFEAATLIPAVLILRRILDRPLLPLLTVGTSVFFINSLHELFGEADVLSRLLFMLELLVLAGFSAIALRPGRLSDVPPEMLASRLFRVIGYGLRAVFAFSSIAFLAEASGYSALADLIGGALILSIYAAIVLYGTVRVLDGVVALLIRVRPLRLLGMVGRHQWLIRRRADVILQFAAWYIWIRFTLRRAQLWDEVAHGFRRLLDAQLPFPEVAITVGSLLAAAIVFWGALLFSRFLQFALAEDVYTRVALPQGRPYAVSTLVHYGMLVLGLVLAALALGFDADRATLLTGAFGVGIGFGLQTIVNNFISGIILLTERPIQVGDTIGMGNVVGEVQRIGIRSSTVRTFQGAEVIVPNADLIAQQVTNWTKSDRRRRIEVPVGVAYGSDPRRVIETLLRAAAGVDKVLPEPAALVLFKGFGESALDFELRAWTGDFDTYMQTQSELCVRMAACLAEAGITVPFPQRDLHVRTVPTDARAEQQRVGPPAHRRDVEDERQAG